MALEGEAARVAGDLCRRRWLFATDEAVPQGAPAPDVRLDGAGADMTDVAVAGSGNVRFDGTANSLEASIAGSGDVRITEVTGPVSRSIVGSGEVRIGR